jgi:hypothetical protein
MMTGVAGPDTRWQRADEVLTRRTTRSVLVLVPESRHPLLLGGAARAVWEVLAHPVDDSELVDRVAGQLGVDTQRARNEVVSTRIALQRAGAVVEA